MPCKDNDCCCAEQTDTVKQEDSHEESSCSCGCGCDGDCDCNCSEEGGSCGCES